MPSGYSESRGSHEFRFWSKVNKTETCWLWTGQRKPLGYGIVTQDSKNRAAHRVAYLWMVGPIPDGLVLDHLCRNPPCVRPDHLEPVTRAENNRRGIGFSFINSHKFTCPRGHEYVRVSYTKQRICRECRRMFDNLPERVEQRKMKLRAKKELQVRQEKYIEKKERDDQ